MNLSHTLFRTARRVPRAVAVIERDRSELTYEQLARRVLRLARGLEGLGVKRGGRVGLLAKNCGAYIELLYACWTLGAAAVPVNTRLHPKEVAFILDDAEARVCFVTDDAETGAIEAARLAGSTRFIDVDRREYAALFDEEPPTLSGSATDAAWLFYTSGTTGRPKGVVLTHGNLMAMTLNYLADVDHAAVGDHLLHAAPMSHGSGLYAVSEHRRRCNAGDPRDPRVRSGRDSPGARLDSEREILRGANDGDAPRGRHRIRRRERRT